MSVVYARAADGSLEPVKILHVFAEAGLDPRINEFLQMNELAASFLEAADAAYTDDNAASVSVVADYETPEGDADRPLGYPLATTSGVLYLQNEDSGEGWKQTVSDGDIRNVVYNAIPGKTYQYLVKGTAGKLLENGRIRPTGKVRMIRFYGYNRNCRDLGGWACDGGSVNYGKLFRSGVVASSETWIDPQIGENIGIRHHIDFRGDEEASYITQSTLGARVRYHRFPLELYYADCVNVGGSDFANLKKVFRTILDAAIHGEGVIYNCSLGRDRTGTVTFLLLALLGVARADIDKDYELTGFSAMDTPAYRTRTDYNALADYLDTFGGDSLRDNAVWWFIKAGFSLAELNAFRAAMTDGAPDELTAEDFVDTYTVTYHLSGCTSSNEDALAEGGSAYTATLALAAGYKHWTSVAVTMGGADVTADVYADGVITISSVTGDIVVTAAAAKYINQLPLATDTDGSIYNSVGYKTQARIDSNGAVVEANGMAATGFIPCALGDVVRMQGINFNSESSNYDQHRIVFYAADQTLLEVSQGNKANSDPAVALAGVYDSYGNLIQFTVQAALLTNLSAVACFRICADTFSGSAIITVNEEIE